jgi:putative resolvase
MRKQYRIGEFAKRIGKATSTVRRWEREGKLVSRCGAGGQRDDDESDVQKALRVEPSAREKITIVYCRVSSAGQKADLRLQAEAMRTFCLGAGVAVEEWIEEIGGGLNFKRRKFLDLMDRIERFEIKHLLVAHKDRLVRFGFE